MIRKGESPAPGRVFSSFAARTAPSPISEGAHPCADCVAPCCTTVTLHEFEPQTFRDVDYLGYLVGFSRIELGWLPSGTVEINYRAFCDHFDRPTGKCRVHGDDAQPLVCVDYDAHQCTYKSQYLEAESQEMIRVSAGRFPSIARLFAYDIKGTIVERPAFSDVAASLNDASTREKKSVARQEETPYSRPSNPFPLPGDSLPGAAIPHQKLSENPCTGCAAFCCRMLIFPLPAPTDRLEVSFYRYITGFPGLEVAVTPRGFVVQCFSKCQHLSDTKRCNLYGKANRPVFCTAYDAWNCSFVPTYEHGTSLFRRFNKNEWPEVETMFRYSDEGTVTYVPTYEDVLESMDS